MRELKFRYVYKNTRTGEIRSQILRLQAIEESGREFILPRAIEVLIARDEFIGIQDKQGKDIYEGDIIEGVYNRLLVRWLVKELSVYGTTFERLTIDSERPLIGIIFYHNMRHREQWEIIGNIYENPDLVKPDA